MMSIIAVLEFPFKLIVMIWAMPANMFPLSHPELTTKHTLSDGDCDFARVFFSLGFPKTHKKAASV